MSHAISRYTYLPSQDNSSEASLSVPGRAYPVQGGHVRILTGHIHPEAGPSHAIGLYRQRYRGTSLIRNSTPPKDHRRDPSIFLIGS